MIPRDASGGDSESLSPSQEVKKTLVQQQFVENTQKICRSVLNTNAGENEVTVKG